MRRYFVSIVGVALLTLFSANTFGAVPIAGWGYSLGYGIGRVAGVNPQGRAWIGWWDPPADVIRGQVTWEYDPSLITIHPELSGFVGDFSDDPSVVVPHEPSEIYPDFFADSFPGPRPGMTYSLTVTVDRVILTFDLGVDPIVMDTSDHVVFFGLFMETSVPLTGWTVENTATGQFREVGSFADQSETFMICSSGSGEYACGLTTDPARGFGLSAIPVPSTLALVIIGAVGILRRRSAWSGYGGSAARFS